MLTERQLQLVKYLQECDGYTTAGKLAEVFHVSSRSIRNDLDAVQYYLKELPVEIERTPRLGVRLIVKKGFDTQAFIPAMRSKSIPGKRELSLLLFC